MRIAIIGAGCSGLTAIKGLIETGLENVVCFEKSDRLGGNWAFSLEEGHSSVMETTHLISSKKMSQFSDFPMPADYPDYPSHQQVLAYFEAYAQHFDLEKYIRYRTAVERAEPVDGLRWRLSLSNGTEEVFDALIVANGHHSAPRHPEWKEAFRGRYMHAHAMKTARDLAGLRVLVVGAGNSGCDCAVEASRVAKQVDISLRTPQYIVPKFFMGKPTDTFAASMSWLPRSIQNVLQRLCLRIQIGRYRDYGLPEPNFSPTHAHPTINSELLERIRHGKIRPRPAIAEVKEQTVSFVDGAKVSYDVIIAATGYRIHFPFFRPELINWEDATHIPLYLRVFHPHYPTLFFIGLVQPQGCIWPLSEMQARLVARVLTGRVSLPSNWTELAYQEADRIRKDFLPRPRHVLEVHFLPYLKALQRATEGRF
ncbi:MAG: NAD(P)-binding domain-containing protein [Saprospiraceae bacterium]|nr:NAD(P)-binding domain-containing protein [Saprospiraceae bacterium]MDW8484193.1 NAD(P)-binding domain-containing protein [Saprospiraceae bacterium]